jgi:uncharacterized membrane protein
MMPNEELYPNPPEGAPEPAINPTSGGAPEPPYVEGPNEAPVQGTEVFDTATPPSNPAPLATASQASDEDRLMAALAWVSMVILQIPVVSLVLLLSQNNKNRPFQRYHAVTSIMFWVVAFVYEVLAGIAFTILSIISFGLLALCLWVIFFLPHLAAIYYAVLAYQGREPEIPFISRGARDQHWV